MVDVVDVVDGLSLVVSPPPPPPQLVKNIPNKAGITNKNAFFIKDPPPYKASA